MMGRIRELFRWRVPAKEASQSLWSRHKPFVRLHQAVHSCVIAPTGSGKNVSLIFPYLLSSGGPESQVVVDFKAESAKLTARHREKMFGHRIVLLDPYRSFTQKPDCLNPLDSIDKTSALALDDCNDLADAIVVRDSMEKERHWGDSATAYVAGIAATTVGYGEEGSRSMQTVREIISNPGRLELATNLMSESDLWDGMLKPMGGQLMQFTDKEKSSVLSTTLRHLRFLGTPAIAESTATSSFDPNQLRRGKMTVYLILPPDHARAQSGL